MPWGMFTVALGMAVGGLLNARKVAETMSNKITKLNHGQGFTAILVTSIIVIFASKLLACLRGRRAGPRASLQ